MAKYIPGALINEATARIQDSEAVKVAFKKGLYHGQYVVAEKPPPYLTSELEEIRSDALARWPKQLVNLDEILTWVGDTIDPTTRAKLSNFPSRTDRDTTILLISRGIFERRW